MTFLSMFGLGMRAPDDPKPGDSYRRWQNRSVAAVIAIRRDLVGIPHVLFWVAFECSAATACDEGWRTLALESFREVYRERVHQAAAIPAAPITADPEMAVGIA
jgi:hypothetical protein